MALVFFIFLSLSKPSFAEHKILGWQFSPPRTLNISSTASWLLWFLMRSWLFILLENPCISRFPSLLLLSGFSLRLCLSTVWYDVSVCGSLWVYLNGSSLSFLYRFMFFPQMQEVSGPYFFGYSFCPFWPLLSFWIPMCICRWARWCPTSLLGSDHLSSFFCSFCFLECIIPIDLFSDSLILSFA